MENGMVRCLLVSSKDASTIVFFFLKALIIFRRTSMLVIGRWRAAGRIFPRPQTRVEPY